jgi:hypothetical protein
MNPGKEETEDSGAEDCEYKCSRDPGGWSFRRQTVKH